MTHRQGQILNLLPSGEKVLVNELAEKLNVSQATIRQDLTWLENNNFLRRIHGGAILDESDDISHRMSINFKQKQSVAKLAATHVNEGEIIFIESGSINALFARELTTIPNITIITTNSFIAREIGSEALGTVVLLGGIYQHESECVVGTLAKTCLDTLNFTKAFIGIDGFTPETGFTGRDMMRAEINSYVIKKSPRTFILTDYSKFGRIALSRYCGMEDIHYLITDKEPPESYRAALEKQGVKVEVAPE